MYINRILEKEVVKYLKGKEAVAILGPRQSGKTTLLKHMFEKLENGIFLDFEDRETLELFDQDLKTFTELYVKKFSYLFIDEFQYAKQGGKNLKYITDNFKTKVVISGSSASGLAINSIKYLVGRIFTFNLFPFSFDEYLSYKDPELYAIYRKTKPSKPVIDEIFYHFNNFCTYGGYPRVAIAKNNAEREIVLKNIYNTYFLKEIKEVLNLPDDYKLSKLIKALALQTGGMANYNELCQLSGFKYPDLLRYMNVLEKTFITVRSQPFYTNKRIELVKTPKIFFLDNGFRNTVVKNFQLPQERPDKGSLYENFVASEIVKNGLEPRYWRTKSKAEVDFIVEKKGINAIEVKASLSTPKLTKSLLSFSQEYKPKSCGIVSEKLWADKNKIKYRPILAVSKEFLS